MGRDIHPVTWKLIQVFSDGIEMRRRGESSQGVLWAAVEILDGLDDMHKGDVIIDLLALYYDANQEVANQWIQGMEKGCSDE